MGSRATKKRKLTKAARRRRRQAVRWGAYAGSVVLCVICLVIFSHMGRGANAPAEDWYVRNAEVQIAAPAGDVVTTAMGRPGDGVINPCFCSSMPLLLCLRDR